ncbi:MAG: oxidative damage protection protein [Anaerolineae bacterium]|nr:oxidative damage protection protein [Anaerolineae bacterium]
MVYCVKLKQTLPGLERPPFAGELGQRIYEHISAAAWDMWKRQAVMLVNHYGLIGVDPDARKWLNEQMEAYLFEDDEPVPEGWLPEDQAGGAKGAPNAKGAPSAKGAPAPQSK